MPANGPGSANGNWKGGGRILSCQRCGTSFAVGYNRRDTAKFCSLKCASAVGADKIRGKRERHITKLCTECGAPFSVYTSRANRIFFCAPECHARWRSRRMADAGNPNWLGGLSREPYPHDWARRSKAIRKRDGDRCQSPRCRGNSLKTHVHHIDYDKKNCAWTNLITVCASCNARANFEREGWQRMYESLMRDRGLTLRIDAA